MAFQLIEHLSANDRDIFLKDVKTKYLKKDGSFFLATPNKNITSYKLKKPIMPYHIHEFAPTELKDELKKYFSEVKCYGQISKNIIGKIKAGKYSYKTEYNKGLNLKLLRFVSQISIVRVLAKILPIKLKNFIRRVDEDAFFEEEFVIVSGDQNLIDNSFILICECKN